MWRSVRKLFLFKLIATFSVILVISFVIILLYSDGYLNQKAMSGLENDSVRALGIMRSFVDSKMSAAQRLVASLYNTNAYSIIPAGMSSAQELPYDQLVRFNAAINDFLQSAMVNDLDIINISIAGRAKSTVTMVSKGASSSSALSRALCSQLQARADILEAFGPTLLPACVTDDVQFRQYLLPVYSRIKSMNMMEDTGYLMVDFSCSSLDLLLKESTNAAFPSRRLILFEDRTAVYDSERLLIQAPFPVFSDIVDKGDGLRRVEGNFINCEYDQDNRLYYLSICPVMFDISILLLWGDFNGRNHAKSLPPYLGILGVRLCKKGCSKMKPPFDTLTKSPLVLSRQHVPIDQ